MAFSSVQFLFIFLPLSLAVYWLLPKALRNGHWGRSACCSLPGQG